MGIYIKSIEMPTGCSALTLKVWPDGQVEIIDTDEEWKTSEAFPVPPHGRLIDADALLESIKEAKKKQPEIFDVYDEDYFMVAEWVAYAPTIIPTEEELA